MPVNGHFRISGNRPGVYAGLTVAPCTLFRIYLCHACLRASCSSKGKRPASGPDNRIRRLPQPDVNVGLNTAFGEKGRKTTLQSAECTP